MTPLDDDDRKKGRSAMEKSLTRQERVIRRHKAGRRPKSFGFAKPSPLQAINQLFNEIDKAHSIMHEEGVDANTLSWQLHYYANRSVQLPVTPSKGFRTSTQHAVELLNFFDGIREPIFLQIQWSLSQATRGEKDQLDTDPDWSTYFNSYPLNTQLIRAALEAERGNKT